MITRQFYGKQQNFTGEHFWKRDYAVSTVGFNENEIRQYIRDQEPSDDIKGDF